MMDLLLGVCIFQARRVKGLWFCVRGMVYKNDGRQALIVEEQAGWERKTESR